MGYPGYYVSNMGRVQSRKREYPIIMQQRMRHGCMVVAVWERKKLITVYVARAVLSAFRGYPADPWLCVANHLNGNKEDCTLSNLEWYVCQTTDEYDPEVSHRRGVLKPEFTKERMTESKRFQSEDTKKKIIESRNRTLKSKKVDYRRLLEGREKLS